MSLSLGLSKKYLMPSYRQTQDLAKESLWQNLANILVREAVTCWLESFAKPTAKNYAAGINLLATYNLIALDTTLQRFSLINHNAIIDEIKKLPNQSECSKQARAACYISFTRYLCRRTQGMIARAIPAKEGNEKTFFKVRDKVATNAMTQKQWSIFLRELSKYNKRDCLIAKLIIQGGKRMSEVLELTTDQINFDTREITYKQSKTRGYNKQTVITYPQAVIEELKAYLKDRTGTVFLTRCGLRVLPTQLQNSFAAAGRKAKIPFKVTPHVLRASTVTYLKKEGFSDSDIMKVTGHASAEMVHAYDKSERADNPTKIISLI
jgi:integrase